LIWGAGAQSKLLRNKTLFLKEVNVSFLVDPGVKKYSKQSGTDVFGTKKAIDTDLPILIGAVQSAPQIYMQILELGINKNRIIKDLII